MMNARLSKALVALLAVAAVGACDDPPIEPGSSDATRLATNPSLAVIEAGETRLVQTYFVNQAGNPVAGQPSFEPCNAMVSVEVDPDQLEIQPGRNLLITAGNTLGETCVNVSGNGFDESIRVLIVPAEVSLTAPAEIGSGETVAATLAFLNDAGTALTGFGTTNVTFSSLNGTIASVDAEGNITGAAPGTARIVATLKAAHGASRADTVTVEVVPGEFSGTISPTSAEPGDTVVITAGAFAFDATTELTFGGEPGNILSESATEIEVIIPFGGVGEFLLTGLGEGEIASVGTYTTTTTTTDDPYENQAESDDGFGNPPDITVPINFYGSVSPGNANDIVEFVAPATGNYTVSVGWWEGDADIDAFIFPAGAALTCGNDRLGCAGATTANPEGGVAALTAGTTYRLWVNLYDDHDAGTVTYEVNITAP